VTSIYPEVKIVGLTKTRSLSIYEKTGSVSVNYSYCLSDSADMTGYVTVINCGHNPYGGDTVSGINASIKIAGTTVSTSTTGDAYVVNYPVNEGDEILLYVENNSDETWYYRFVIINTDTKHFWVNLRGPWGGTNPNFYVAIKRKIETGGITIYTRAYADVSGITGTRLDVDLYLHSNDTQPCSAVWSDGRWHKWFYDLGGDAYIDTLRFVVKASGLSSGDPVVFAPAIILFGEYI